MLYQVEWMRHELMGGKNIHFNGACRNEIHFILTFKVQY